MKSNLRKEIHMAMLSKSANAKDLGDLTVVPLGFAVDIALIISDAVVDSILPAPPANVLPDGEISHHTYNDGKRDLLRLIRETYTGLKNA